MIRAIPTLAAPHTVCEKGKASTPEQAQSLKLIGVRTVRFKVGLRVEGEASSGEIIEVQGQEIANDTCLVSTCPCIKTVEFLNLGRR